jgi:hypothetical protein
MLRLTDKPHLLISAVVIAALTTLEAGSSTARASCGDYVDITGQPMTIGHVSNAHFRKISGSSRDDSGILNLESTTYPIPIKSPCQGPNCRRKIPDPATPIPVVSSSPQPESASLISHSAELDAQPGRFVAVSSDKRLLSMEMRIERPPRIDD